MKKLFFTFVALFFTGCASFHLRVIGWYNDDTSVMSSKIVFNNGDVARIAGNPHITCYARYGNRIADGYFVRVEEGYLIVDEFGRNFIYIPSNQGNYCIFGEEK